MTRIDGAHLLSRLAPALLVISTATVTVAYYQIHGPALHALMLIGLLWIIRRFRNRAGSDPLAADRAHAAPFQLSPATALLSGVFLLYALLAVLSAATVGFNPDALNRLENFSYFLGGVWLLPFLVSLRLRPDWFWLAIGATALLSGLFAFWEVRTLGHAVQIATGLDYRAGGSKGKAIPFGDIATLATVLSLLAACVFFQARRRAAWLFVLAAFAGLYASLASGTRGAWIFFPTALIVIGIYLLQQFPAYRRAILLGGLGLMLAGGIALVQSGQLQERLTSAVSEIQNYVPGDSVQAGNSLGERFEMWRAAWMAFREHPLLGIGVGQLNGYFKQAAGQGLISSAIAEFDQGAGHTHAHNDYIHALATRGLLGLTSLLLLYFVPLAVFARAAMFAQGHAARAPGYAGILTILGYMQFSLTDSILLMRITAGFFVLLCSWLLALTLTHGSRR
jgi:O-antigen ligase